MSVSANKRLSLIIVTTDHGQTNIVNKTITYYFDICKCLVRMPSIEARDVNIFIKPEKLEYFPAIFNKHFDKSFILLSNSKAITT